MNPYKKNLALWAKERPVEAFRIENTETTVYRLSKNGNLKTPYGFLYKSDPLQEAQEWFLTLDLQGKKVLYIYGIGLGTYYLPLKRWLDEDAERHVIFFDDDYAIIKKFLSQELATEILKNPQVTVCHLDDPKDEEGVLETLYWSFVLTPFQVSALEFYHEKKKNQFVDFKYKITYSNTVKNSLVEEYLNFGVSFLRNFYPNMLRLYQSKWGNQLFQQFKGIPAIICGAGPSLEKQIPFLQSLKDKALIFGGGSALNALLSKSLTPHFGAGIDPNPTQKTRLEKTHGVNIPFFYRSRLFFEALPFIAGEKLYISGAGGYDVAEWYEENLRISSDFLDEGHNVVNFCTEIAVQLGCNPIIFVGMDLAYTEKKLYSKGVETIETPLEDELIEKQDIYGNPIFTLWKWIAEADWISKFAKEHPEVTLINGTEGGIGFPNVFNQSLQEIAQKYLTKDLSLSQLIKDAVAKSTFSNVTQENLASLTIELKDSLKRAVKEIDILLKHPPKENGETSGRAALAETDLYEEPAYKYILDIFHQVFARVQNKKAMAIRLNKKNLSETQLHKEKWELQKEKLFFLKHVAEANIAIIDWAQEVIEQ